jgi:hypothetical protein
METITLIKILENIQSDIIKRDLEGAYGRCAVLVRSLLDEELGTKQTNCIHKYTEEIIMEGGILGTKCLVCGLEWRNSFQGD